MVRAESFTQGFARIKRGLWEENEYLKQQLKLLVLTGELMKGHELARGEFVVEHFEFEDFPQHAKREVRITLKPLYR